MGRPGGPGPLDPIFDVPTSYGSIAVGGTPGAPLLAVTINQGSEEQADPAFSSPIVFDVVFSEATSDFITGDVTITGTAGGTPVATIVDTGDQIYFTVNVTGMTTGGTVIASIAAGVCHADSSGIPNLLSTSTDNTVTWNGVIPTDFGGLWGWWDATIGVTGGAAVTQWDDQSGNTRHLTPGAAASPNAVSRTQNGRPVIDFNGTTQGIGRTGVLGFGTSTWTLFFVGGQDDTAIVCGLISFYNSSGHDYDNGDAFTWNTGNHPAGRVIELDMAGTGVWIPGGTGATPAAVWAIRKDSVGSAGNITFWKNGTIQTTDTLSAGGVANGGMSIGWRAREAGLYLNGYCAEAVAYSSILTNPQIVALSASLATKWGF